MRIPFDQLSTADLVVGAIYEGGDQGTLGDEPVSKLLTVGNQGGIRIGGKAGSGGRRVVLYTTGSVPEWPDRILESSGQLIYFGDNRTPGRDLHDPKGNQVMRDSFLECSKERPERAKVPPFFVFEKLGESWSIAFRGLAVPGAATEDGEEDLVAIWRSVDGNGFLNYKARFTLLDAPRVGRAWIDSIIADRPDEGLAPLAWNAWLNFGVRIPLGPEWITVHEKARGDASMSLGSL